MMRTLNADGTPSRKRARNVLRGAACFAAGIGCGIVWWAGPQLSIYLLGVATFLHILSTGDDFKC